MLISAVIDAMEILESLADHPQGQSVSELSARAKLNKGSIARVLITLQHSGHVMQDLATERYHLTLKAISIANRHMDRLGFADLIQPTLDSMARETGELAQLSACDGDRLFVIAKAEGDNRIRVESLLGREIALHASATGKAWLSALPPERAMRILATSMSAGKLTPHTITDLKVLQKELDKARSRGFAMQREELMEHMSAIAVPVWRGSDEDAVVGALVIAAPTFRFPAARMSELIKPLQDAAQRIGRAWPTSGIVSLHSTSRANARSRARSARERLETWPLAKNRRRK